MNEDGCKKGKGRLNDEVRPLKAKVFGRFRFRTCSLGTS